MDEPTDIDDSADIEVAPATPRRPGRPRSEASHQAILRTALELAREKNLGDVTVDEIAKRSGTSKATIYRWWRSKEELIVEALREALDPVPFPDTGTLRGDLEEMLRYSVRVAFSRPDSAVTLMMRLHMDVGQDPKLVDACRAALWDPRRDVQRAVLQRWIDRGELPADLDIDLTIEAMIGPLIYSMLYFGLPSQPKIDARLDMLLEGLAPRRSR